MKTRITYLNKTSRLEKPIGKLLLPLMMVFFVFYLVFNALSGERGIYALLKEERRLESLKKELQTVSDERKDMETRVRLMSAGSLDRDMLDEQARLILNSAGEDEVIVPLRK